MASNFTQETRFALLVNGVEIPAALTLPENPKAAVLLIPGSVNSDVDGNYAPMFPGQPASAPHFYLDLAHQLTAEGIAVLRFAKIGPGTGCVIRDQDVFKAHYGNFLNRVKTAAAFLDELARLLPSTPRAIAGHSEGAVVATLLAQQSPALKGLILVGGPSKPLLQLMIWQRYVTAGTTGMAADGNEPAFHEAMAAALDYAACRPVPNLAGNPFAAMFGFWTQPSNEPYLRSLEQVDPAAELARTTLPVLLLQGGRDASVIPANAALLAAARPGVEVVRFPTLQHFFKFAPDGITPEQNFALSTESDPAVAAALASWLVGS